MRALATPPPLTPPPLATDVDRGIEPLLLSTNSTSGKGKLPLRELPLGIASEYDATVEDDTCCCCGMLGIVLVVDVSPDPSPLMS